MLLVVFAFAPNGKCTEELPLRLEREKTAIYSLTSTAGVEIGKYNAHALIAPSSDYVIASVGGSDDTSFIQLIPLQSHEYLIKREININSILKRGAQKSGGSPIEIMPIAGSVSPNGLFCILGRLFILTGERSRFISADIQEGYYHSVTPLPLNERVAALFQKSAGQTVRVFHLSSGDTVEYNLKLLDVDDWPAQQLVWLNDDHLISILKARRSPEYRILRLTSEGNAVEVVHGSLAQALLLFNANGQLELFHWKNEKIWNQSQVWPVPK
jgi:hypothetical protein